jgi:hypothetical protein
MQGGLKPRLALVNVNCRKHERIRISEREREREGGGREEEGLGRISRRVIHVRVFDRPDDVNRTWHITNVR